MKVKGFGGATFKSFKTRPEAASFIAINTASSNGSANPSLRESQSSYQNAKSTSSTDYGNNTAKQCSGDNQNNRDTNTQHEGIYIHPQCHTISSYNMQHPDKVQLDKLKRAEGHIGAGLVSRIYAVKNGRKVGVFSNWNDCQKQIKGYTRSSFKSFYSIDDALQFIKGSSNNNDGKQDRKRLAENVESTSNKSTRHNDNQYDLEITIHFDGGSRGNPGTAGAGAEVKVLSKDKCTIHHVRKYCGEKQTNNYAEYTGLIEGLKVANECIMYHSNAVGRPEVPSWRPSYRIFVYGDSNLVIQQMNGCWQCKNANIQPLYKEACALKSAILDRVGLNGVVFEHVYREQNKVADGEY